MGWIYKITNSINGKTYIGKTEHIDPEKRWQEHLKDYKRRRCEKRPLYEAIRKYGEEVFTFEVIEQTNSPEQTCEREIFWINELRTYIGFEDCNGYNATLGGDGKKYLDLDEEEVIQYFIDQGRYIKATAEHFNVDFSTIKKILIKNKEPLLDKVSATEYRNFMKHGLVYKVDSSGRFILDLYLTPREAAREGGNNPKSAAGISRACLGQNDHKMKGFLWYYGMNVPKDLILLT